MVDLKVLHGTAPSITSPSRLPLLWVGPMTNVGVALMLWSDASERLALISANVDSCSMQALSLYLLRSASPAMVRTPLQPKQFCWSNRLEYISQ